MIIKLVVRNMLGNIRKTVISVLCICFTVMLIFVSINTYISFQRMRLYDAYDAYGEYNIVLHNITMEQYNWIKESYTEEAKIGVENIVEVMETGINILKCDDRSIEMNRYRMSEGNFPIKQNEVAISATAKKEGRYIINNYEIGDRIELGKSSFIISGIIDDYDYSTVDTYKIAITAGDISSDSYNVYLHFYAKQDYINAIPNILDNFGLEKEDICEEGKREGFLGTYKLILNSDLNIIEIEGKGSLQDINIGILLVVFAVIIVLTSLILGTHIILSYLNDRNVQQGTLMSLGFSNHCITSMYIMECLFLTSIGCVLGLVVGKYLTVGLFRFIQSMRIVELEHFVPQFTRESIFIVVGISIMNFMMGMLPVVMRNRNKGIVDVIKGVNNQFKYDIMKIGRIKSRFITIKYFRRDNRTYEKVCIYFSLILIGSVFLLLILVNKYIDYMLENREQYDSAFELLSDDISVMGGFRDLIPEIEYYNVVYSTMGDFYINNDDINEKYKADISYGENDSVACEVVGVSQVQYENKIELSKELTYDEFVESGKAIVIDNWTTQEEPILNVLPESMEYEGRCESGGVKFETGTISILGRSKFKNWSDQRKISIVVPDSLFLDKFDYTNALIKINVTQGSEIECAAKLNKYAYTYRYTFLDHASEYIKEQDDNTTIRSGTYGILIFVTCINLFSILYINILTYMRRRKNLSILKILGYSNMNLIVPILFEMITEGFVATIIAEFTVTVLTKCFVPKYTQDIVLVNGFLDMTYIFIVIVLVQVVSVVMIWFRLMKQKVIHDLRLQ